MPYFRKDESMLSLKEKLSYRVRLQKVLLIFITQITFLSLKYF